MNPFKEKVLELLTISSVSIKEVYKSYRKILNLLNLLDYKIVKHNREIPVRIFRPKRQKNCKLLIFFHGGGWVTGNIDSYTKV